MNFDTKTSEQLAFYVYALLDPADGQPFYIGKGKGNRVFEHLNCALENATQNDKYDKIREIEQGRGKKVKHLILRHGMTEQVAFEVEATLIDLFSFLEGGLTNIQSGHSSGLVGLMTTDEVIRKYNAEDLDELSDPAIIININRTYKEHRYDRDGIYQATRSSWIVGESRRKSVRYALSEYRGLIVEVFEIIGDWYPVPRSDKKNKNGEPQVRWAFEGKVAEDQIRNKYINKSVAHLKKPGAANPIRYTV